MSECYVIKYNVIKLYYDIINDDVIANDITCLYDLHTCLYSKCVYCFI